MYHWRCGFNCTGLNFNQLEQAIRVHYKYTNAQIDIQQGGETKGNYFLPPPLNISRGGGQEKCVYYTWPWKKKLTNSGYFGGKFFNLGAFIQFGAKLCGINLKLYFRGKFYFLGAIFLVGGNLKSLFLGQFLFKGIFKIFKWAFF